MAILYHQLPGASAQASEVLNNGVWLLLMNVITCNQQLCQNVANWRFWKENKSMCIMIPSSINGNSRWYWNWSIHQSWYWKQGPRLHNVFLYVWPLSESSSWLSPYKRFTVSRRMNTATFTWLPLTHLSQCRIYASLNWVIIVPGNGLSPFRRQAITWTNTELLLIGSLGTNFSESRIKLKSFSFIKMHLKMSSAKWCPFCPGGDELKVTRYT